jgi:hypothetical protein
MSIRPDLRVHPDHDPCDPVTRIATTGPRTHTPLQQVASGQLVYRWIARAAGEIASARGGVEC